MALVGWLAGREQASMQEVARYLEQTEQETQALLNRLVEQGVLVETRNQGWISYHIHFAPRRRRQATPAIWQALDTPEMVGPHKRDEAQDVKKQMRLKRVKEWVQ